MIEVLKQALDALESCTPQDTSTGHVIHAWHDEELVNKSITSLCQAIKELESQEPVANDPLPRACNLAGVDYQTFLKIKAYMPVAPPQRTEQEPVDYEKLAALGWQAIECGICGGGAMGYPQRTWVGLTSHERMMCRSFYPDEAVAKTEAKLKEKNT